MYPTKKAWLNPTIRLPDLYHVLGPTIFVCRICGLFPLVRLRGSTSRKRYSTSYLLVICTTIIQIIDITVMLISSDINSDRKIRYDGAQHFVVLMEYCQVYLGSIMIIIIAVSTVCNKNKIMTAIEVMNSQDSMLRKLGVSINHSKDLRQNRIRIITVMAMLIIFCIVDFSYDLQYSLSHWISWWAWCYPICISTLNIYLFATLVLVAKQRFLYLNEMLQNIIREINCTLIEECDKGSSFISIDDFHRFNNRTDNSAHDSRCAYVSHAVLDHRKTTLKIRAIATIHGSLCEAMRNLNDAFGYAIVATVINALVTVETGLYFTFREIKDSTLTQLSFYQIAGYLNWTAGNSVSIVYLIIVCNLTRNQATRTAKLLHNFSVCGVHELLDAAIQSFSMQLNHEKVEFTAAKFFSLDSTLIQSIIGALTTYLIILIQFDSISH